LNGELFLKSDTRASEGCRQ